MLAMRHAVRVDRRRGAGPLHGAGPGRARGARRRRPVPRLRGRARVMTRAELLLALSDERDQWERYALDWARSAYRSGYADGHGDGYRHGYSRPSMSGKYVAEVNGRPVVRRAGPAPVPATRAEVMDQPQRGERRTAWLISAGPPATTMTATRTARRPARDSSACCAGTLTRYVVLPSPGGGRRDRAVDRGHARGAGVELRAAARHHQPGQAVRQEPPARHHRGDLPRPAADREHQPGRAGPLDRRRPADAAARRGRHRVRPEGRRQPRGSARHPQRRALAGTGPTSGGTWPPGQPRTARRSPWPRSPGSAPCPTRSPTGRSSCRCAAGHPAR